MGLHATFIKQLTKDQILIAGPCGRVTPEVLFFFPLLILFVREAVNNSKTFAVCFDVTEWAPCSLQLSSICGKIISRALGEERC